MPSGWIPSDPDESVFLQCSGVKGDYWAMRYICVTIFMILANPRSLEGPQKGLLLMGGNGMAKEVTVTHM